MPNAFIFTKKGRVQLLSQGKATGMIIAPTRKLAEQFAAWYQRTRGVKLTIAQIGTVQGETLKKQLETSEKEGANCGLLLTSFDGGNPSFQVMTRGGESLGLSEEGPSDE